MSAFFVLLQKQKEALKKGRNFSMKDIKEGFKIKDKQVLSEYEADIIINSSRIYKLMLPEIIKPKEDREEQINDNCVYEDYSSRQRGINNPKCLSICYPTKKEM